MTRAPEDALQKETMETVSLDRIRGCLFGLAYGDAFAAAAEFLSVDEIKKRWPPAGPTTLTGNPALITDDTQMATAVGEAMVTAFATGPTVSGVQTALASKFAAWFHSSDNTRAPGLTCLSAAARLSQGFPWHQCTIVHSKGCGTNMRVAPVGLLPLDGVRLTEDGARLDISTLAQMQAAMTHGHPTALAASDLTAHAVAFLAAGHPASELLAYLNERIADSRFTYHGVWLGELSEQPGYDSAEQYVGRGWAECARALERVEEALAADTPPEDPCELTGSGWIAEEALATALFCFLESPEDPVRVLQRAAVTRGDSDSIAAIAGAFAGASLGFDAWPTEWHERIETRPRLEALAASLARIRA